HGGSILLSDVANSGHTLTATPTTGNLKIGDVTGGILATTGGAKFVSHRADLKNVTLTRTIPGSPTAVNLTLDGGNISLVGGPNVYSSSTLWVDASAPLDGNGLVLFEGDTNFNEVGSTGGSGMATLSPGITVRTSTGGGLVYFVINEGTISSQTPGR